MSQPRSRPRHHRGVKSKHVYREPDSDTDLENHHISTKTLPTRLSRRTQTYRELTSSDDDESSDTSEPVPSHPNQIPPNTRAIKKTLTRKTVRRSQRTRQKDFQQKASDTPWTMNSLKRRKLQHTDQIKSKISRYTHHNAPQMYPNRDAPPWQTLEYDILLRIMQFAAYPLYTSTTRSSPSIEWLLGVSKLCKSFHDASIATLLRDPPLIPNIRAHGLLRLLTQDQAVLSTNYTTKIQTLNIEVKHLVAKSGFSIQELLKHTPLLSRLWIRHHHDEMIGKAIWAEPAVARFKWSYGRLFDQLDENNIRLKAFEWNGRFQDTLSAVSLAHQKTCMSSLEEVSIVNFNYTDKQEDERAQTRDTLTKALSHLKRLDKLEFRNCTFLDPPTMSRLPQGLKALKVVNCLSLTSEGVSAYLAHSGQTLLDLHFEGNQVMDLGFISILSDTCPLLMTLFIDLSYEDSSSYGDRNPLYDELLPNGGPTWPSTLRSIIIGPLRSLDVVEAEDFYSSLIHSADSLPHLRVLSIKSILANASWRDRARLRAKWRPLFERVFLASKTYPKPARPEDLHRKSARLQELEDGSISEDVYDSGDMSSVASSVPHQNMCEIVEFELSDQRPAQEQFREVDFLDSEPSDDGEWNGRDQTTTGAGYAW